MRRPGSCCGLDEAGLSGDEAVVMRWRGGGGGVHVGAQ